MVGLFASIAEGKYHNWINWAKNYQFIQGQNIKEHIPPANKVQKSAPTHWWEKVHLGEEVPLKLIHFSPFFGQFLQIYRILDIFLPFFKIFGAALAFFMGE